MFYSLLGESKPIYETDEYGNIFYLEMPDGERIPKETGEQTNGYSEPVQFFANIAASGGAAEAEAYGVDLSAYDAILYAPKNLLPLDETTLIWYQNEPEYLPTGDVDPKSADYRVARVPPCLNEIVYLLESVAT